MERRHRLARGGDLYFIGLYTEHLLIPLREKNQIGVHPGSGSRRPSAWKKPNLLVGLHVNSQGS